MTTAERIAEYESQMHYGESPGWISFCANMVAKLRGRIVRCAVCECEVDKRDAQWRGRYWRCVWCSAPPVQRSFVEDVA